MFTFIRFLSICWQLIWQGSRYLCARLIVWNPERVARLRARRIAALFRNLGATFIKLGQILSARPDMLSPALIEELRTLQDQVPAFRYRRARAIIEADLGAPIDALFAELPTRPIAAASIAQVYDGRLLTGERVAVKVQRPRIERTMSRDLAIVELFARVANRLRRLRNLQLPALAREFGRAIRSQLDFALEISNNRQFARNFADVAHVKVPDIFDELSGDRVITMTFVDGHKLTDILDDPPIDRAVLAERILDIYYKMAFVDFFLHADLHPGNILVDDEGNFHLIDTGLVYQIPPHYVRKFFRVCLAMTMIDGRLIGESYLEGVDMDESARAAAIDDMEKLAESYKGRSFLELEMGTVFLDIMAVLRRHKIFLDAEWTGMALSDLTFEGIAKMIDGDIDLMALSARKLPVYAAAHDFIDADDSIVRAASAA